MKDEAPTHQTEFMSMRGIWNEFVGPIALMALTLGLGIYTVACLAR